MHSSVCPLCRRLWFDNEDHRKFKFGIHVYACSQSSDNGESFFSDFKFFRVWKSTLWCKKIAPFYFCNNFVKPHYISIIFGIKYWTKSATKLQQNCPPLLLGVSTLLCEIYCAILLITTAYQWRITKLAVSDKCIPEWLSISRTIQDWDLVYWEAACLVWSPESCVAAAQCFCAMRTRGALESKSRQQLDRCLAATVWAARHHSNSPVHHLLSPLAAWKPHQCTRAESTTETETREYVYQKPARYIHELKWHLIEIWSATSRYSD